MPQDGLAHDRRDVGVRLGGHLAGDVHLAGGDQRLDRDPAARVLREQGVEDAVADLVSDLVRVAFRDRLGGEQAACHGAPQVGRMDTWPRGSVVSRDGATSMRVQAAPRDVVTAVRRPGPRPRRPGHPCFGACRCVAASRRRRARSPSLPSAPKTLSTPTSLTTIRSALLRSELLPRRARARRASRRRRRPAPGPGAWPRPARRRCPGW